MILLSLLTMNHFLRTSFSLLSPNVSSLLSTDEALDSYIINTEYSRGNFQILLDIFRNRKQEINGNDKEVLYEVLEILGNECLQIEFNTNSASITYENVFFSFKKRN